MKNSKKTVYDAWITGVSPAGALYYIPEISQNGFTHVSELEPPQRYLVNNTVLQGQTHCFKIGQKVEARIKSIDMDIFAVKITLRSTQH
jgi:exoribonuclease R